MEELNIALRDEVLYFTLLGLRAAAEGMHMAGQVGDIARSLDLQAIIEMPRAQVQSSAQQIDQSAMEQSNTGDKISDSSSTQVVGQVDEERLQNLKGSLSRMKFSFTAYGTHAHRLQYQV